MKFHVGYFQREYLTSVTTEHKHMHQASDSEFSRKIEACSFPKRNYKTRFSVSKIFGLKSSSTLILGHTVQPDLLQRM
jgi:hypothetical protein